MNASSSTTALLAVFTGGGVGALLRYGIFLWVQARIPLERFPLGTLLVNCLGSFFLGAIAAWGLHLKLSPELKLFLGVGMMGALTTFSTYAVDLLSLLRAQRYLSALLVFFANNLLSIGLAALGFLFIQLLYQGNG